MSAKQLRSATGETRCFGVCCYAVAEVVGVVCFVSEQNGVEKTDRRVVTRLEVSFGVICRLPLQRAALAGHPKGVGVSAAHKF